MDVLVKRKMTYRKTDFKHGIKLYSDINQIEEKNKKINENVDHFFPSRDIVSSAMDWNTVGRLGLE